MFVGIKGTLISQFFAEEIPSRPSPATLARKIGVRLMRPAGWWRRFASEAGRHERADALGPAGGTGAQLSVTPHRVAPGAATRLTARSWTPAAALEVIVAPWGDSIDSVARGGKPHARQPLVSLLQRHAASPESTHGR
jgi:hypothetical protein